MALISHPAAPPVLESSCDPIGLTAYGCGEDEAQLFRQAAARSDAALTITEAPISEGNVVLAAGNRCISVDHKTPLTESTLLALRRVGVRYISTRSAGSDHIDVPYARGVGVTVGTVAYSAGSVADYAVMSMLMLIRDADAIIGRADQHDYRLPERRGRELGDLTVGIIGTGRIGAAVINRLQAFGGRVVASDPRPALPVDYLPVEDLLHQSDIVSLHAPLTPSTHHLLDRGRVEAMKEGACLVNTARGGLVDTQAVVDALETGRLGGAALDVLEGEGGLFYGDFRNTPVHHELLLRLHALPNVFITPHTAYFTDRALREMVEQSLANCVAFEGSRA